MAPKVDLLSPIETKGFGKFSNRIALAALTRTRATATGVVGKHHATHFIQRSDAAFMLTPATIISPQGNGTFKAPQIFTLDQVAAWKEVVDAVHEKNGTLICQLWHQGRASHSDFQPDGLPPFSASTEKLEGDQIHTPDGSKKDYEAPRALTKSQITMTVEQYRQAALNCKAAGFDGVQVHCANGYLIDQFLQSKTNKRTDEYGGSIENRMRFMQEVIDVVLDVWPSEKVGVKLSPNGAFCDMGSPDNLETFDAVIKYVGEKQLGFIELMDGLAFGFHKLTEPYTLERAREALGENRGKTLLVGNCGYDFESGTKAVSSGAADLITYGRPFISNPDLVHRFANGIKLNDDAPMSDWYGTPADADQEKGYNDFPTAK